MDRRGFLAAIAGAFVSDPERALWVPGKKLISIPAPSVQRDPLLFLDLVDDNLVELRFWKNPILCTAKDSILVNGARFSPLKGFHDKMLECTSAAQNFQRDKDTDIHLETQFTMSNGKAYLVSLRAIR